MKARCGVKVLGLLTALLFLPALAGSGLARHRAHPVANLRVAARAINALGWDMLRAAFPTNSNAVLSPYSIQLASVMLYAGSEGKTRKEMAMTLHYGGGDSMVHGSFADLKDSLEEISEHRLVTWSVSNRLYVQREYSLRHAFLELLRNFYRAPVVAVDFAGDSDQLAQEINGWIGEETQHRITNLIAPGTFDHESRVAIVNAVYLKASWQIPFPESETLPRPFLVRGEEEAGVPTMTTVERFSYAKRQRFTIVGIPYSCCALQFLIVLPQKGVSLAELEATLSVADFAQLGQSLKAAPLNLYLPKFRLEPPALSLGETLSRLGMKSAFGATADFRRMTASGNPYVSAFLHKALLAIDERGTEAAAAAEYLIPLSGFPKIDEVHVDRPFLFAIQHIPSGAFLFLGRVIDPR